MKLKTTLLGLSLLCAVAACSPDRYYDANGNYIVDGKIVKPATPSSNVVIVPAPAPVARTYTQAGYYDRRGVFVAPLGEGVNIPSEYWPIQGQCRIWYVSRAPYDQPEPQRCNTIYEFVPANAYVVYGG